MYVHTGRYPTHNFFWTLLWPTFVFLCLVSSPFPENQRQVRSWLKPKAGRLSWAYLWPSGCTCHLPQHGVLRRGVPSSGLFSLLGSGARWWASILRAESAAQARVNELTGHGGEAGLRRVPQGRLLWAGTLAGLCLAWPQPEPEFAALLQAVSYPQSCR